MTPFTLRSPLALAGIPHWAARYDAPYDAGIEALAPAIRTRGRLTLAELIALGEWKSPRIRSRLAANDPAYVEAVTAVALATNSEQLRIEALTLLRGVSWPMASTILHWCHPDPYPVLDYRALWSLGIDTTPRYDFPFWWAYTERCRALAAEVGVSDAGAGSGAMAVFVGEAIGSIQWISVQWISGTAPDDSLQPATQPFQAASWCRLESLRYNGRNCFA